MTTILAFLLYSLVLLLSKLTRVDRIIPEYVKNLQSEFVPVALST
jgi:hypothetical protein